MVAFTDNSKCCILLSDNSKYKIIGYFSWLCIHVVFHIYNNTIVDVLLINIVNFNSLTLYLSIFSYCTNKLKNIVCYGAQWINKILFHRNVFNATKIAIQKLNYFLSVQKFNINLIREKCVYHLMCTYYYEI